jgi:hypothetical protein
MQSANLNTGRRCPSGRHTMDPGWDVCPYCEGEKRSRETIEGGIPFESTRRHTKDFSMEESPLRNVRVFISSTSEDLTDFREAVFSAVQELGGTGEDMLYWSADERRPLDLCLKRVLASDVLILVVAHRYGYIPEGSKQSITELEYRTAHNASIPVLAFLIDPDVPWPPKHIELEKTAELGEFKSLIAKDNIYKPFKSPDDLKALVVTALASFAARYRKQLKADKRFTIKTESVSPTAVLHSQPDATIEIGLSQDGFPLLLKIRRSIDFNYLLTEFESKIQNAGMILPHIAIEDFRQVVEQHSTSVWTNKQVVSVKMTNHSSREMYVTQKNLSDLFGSLFSSILQEGNRVSRERRGAHRATQPPMRQGALRATQPLMGHTIAPKVLESVGGKNRFLGISLRDGQLFSVGWRNNHCVEWRPFLFEDIVSNFPGVLFEINAGGKTLQGEIKTLPETMRHIALEFSDQGGEINCEGYLLIPRQSIGSVIAQIGLSLELLHLDGKIHGDLKPENVLLTKNGPVLVDSFDIAKGSLAQGWTPDWSAPEQVLGKPMNIAADVYPLGKMIAQLLNGRLVGEVRKFRAPSLSGGSDEEFDLFFDPIIYVGEDTVLQNEEQLNFWLEFARACLKFDPEERIQSAGLFSDKLKTLLNECPLAGTVSLPLLQKGRLVPAKWIDGTESVARLVSDS